MTDETLNQVPQGALEMPGFVIHRRGGTRPIALSSQPSLLELHRRAFHYHLDNTRAGRGGPERQQPVRLAPFLHVQESLGLLDDKLPTLEEILAKTASLTNEMEPNESTSGHQDDHDASSK